MVYLKRVQRSYLKLFFLPSVAQHCVLLPWLFLANQASVFLSSYSLLEKYAAIKYALRIFAK